MNNLNGQYNNNYPNFINKNGDTFNFNIQMNNINMNNSYLQ
jgi:hypothetical protein